MRGQIFGLDSTRALIAAKSSGAIVVGYGIGLAFDWKASSIAITIIVLQTATLGTTFNKSILRMVGTLVGAIAGLSIVAVCAHDRDLFILAMALVTAICVWGMQRSAHQYAWMLAMLTCAIVGWPTAMNPLNAFQTSIDRVTAVTVGVILSGIVQGVFWPVTSGKQFERTLHDLVAGCHDLALLVRRGLLEQDIDASAICTMETKILSLPSSLLATLKSARVDSRQFHQHYVQYEQLCDELEGLVLATAAIGGAATLYRQELIATVNSQPTALLRMLDSLDEACVATVQQLSLPRDGSLRLRDPKPGTQQNEDTDSTGSDSIEIQGRAVELLRERIQVFQDISARVRTVLAKVEVAGSRVQSEVAEANAIPPLGARLAKSGLAALQVVLGAEFLIMLNWPLGIQSAMILIMIFAYLNAQLPVAFVARTIFKGALIALPLAAAFHFSLMPLLDSYDELFPWLTLLFFPLLYGVASRNPLTSMSAMLAVILVNSLISISTAPPQYDFPSFANMYLGMGGGIAIVFLLAYLFETRSPRRGLYGVLSAMFTQSADYLKGLEDCFTQAADGAFLDKRQRKQWLQSLGKMKKLSASVDYRQDPITNPAQVGAVMQTCDVLVARLIWPSLLSVAPDSEAEIVKESVNRAHEWCAVTLAATAKAFVAFQPVNIQQPDEALFRDLDSKETGQSDHDDIGPDSIGNSTRSKLTYYRSLADAIRDCQRELNKVDWKRWNQSYF